MMYPHFDSNNWQMDPPSAYQTEITNLPLSFLNVIFQVA